MAIDGNTVLKWEGGELSLSKGEVILIPNIINNIELFPLGTSKLLEIYIP